MEQALSRMDGGEIVGLIASVTALLSFAAVAMSAIIAPRWKEVRRAECELKLKSDLVTAGYAADDIERIVRVSTTPAPRRAAEAAYAYRR